MLRKARVADVKEIHKLINFFARQDVMLARSLNELYENLRDYWVIERSRRVIACCALHVSWEELAEIKSLAVDMKHQRSGLGSMLVKSCLEEAVKLGAKRVFALTYKPQFFKKLGFRMIKHSDLPHKVWAECIHCPKFPNCQEVALIRNL